MKNKINILLNTIFIIFIFPAVAFAAENPDISTGLENVDKNALADKIINIATGAGALAGAVAVVMLVYVGYRMVTATNENGRAEAKGHFVQVLLGLGVVGLSIMLVGFVCSLIKS